MNKDTKNHIIPNSVRIIIYSYLSLVDLGFKIALLSKKEKEMLENNNIKSGFLMQERELTVDLTC